MQHLMYCGSHTRWETLFLLVYCIALCTAAATVGIDVPQFESFNTVPDKKLKISNLGLNYFSSEIYEEKNLQAI